MIYVIAYDIADDRRREDVSMALAAHGARVQLSVFECDLPDPVAVAGLKTKLLELIDTREDQVRLYPLPDNATRVVEILGSRRLEEREDFWIV